MDFSTFIVTLNFTSMFHLIFFNNFIFPIWMVIHCSKQIWREKKVRLYWIGAISICFMIGALMGNNVFIGPLGALLYALFDSRSLKIKSIAVFNILALFVFVFSFLGFNEVYKKNLIEETLNPVELKIKKLNGSQFSYVYRDTILQSIQVLSREIEAQQVQFSDIVFPKLDKKDNRQLLLRLADKYAFDAKFEEEEAENWLELFEQRNTIEPRGIEYLIEN